MKKLLFIALVTTSTVTNAAVLIEKIVTKIELSPTQGGKYVNHTLMTNLDGTPKTAEQIQKDYNDSYNSYIATQIPFDTKITSIEPPGVLYDAKGNDSLSTKKICQIQDDGKMTVQYTYGGLSIKKSISVQIDKSEIAKKIALISEGMARTDYPAYGRKISDGKYLIDVDINIYKKGVKGGKVNVYNYTDDFIDVATLRNKGVFNSSVMATGAKKSAISTPETWELAGLLNLVCETRTDVTPYF